MSHKYTNVRVGKKFYDLLINHPTFQNNPKAIAPSYYLLNKINKTMVLNKKSWANIPGKYIQNAYRPYSSDRSYKQYIDALQELKLVNINDSYLNDIDGFTMSYMTTDLAGEILRDSEKEYFMKLINDKDVKRNNQKNNSKRQKSKTTYTNYLFNYISDLLYNVKYDFDKAMKIIDSNDWGVDTQRSVYNKLIAFETLDFKDLKYNADDNRIFNDFVAMKSDMRKAFTYNNLSYLYTIDIRGCHPTYFAHYIRNYYLTTIKEPTTNHITTYHTDNCDILTNPSVICEIDKEYKKWTELFTSKTVTPKKVLSEALGCTEDEAKERLNSTINGMKTHKPLLRWMEKEFPTLYKVWQTTNVKQTGPNISKHYETVLMADETIFKMGDDMGIKFSPEYDGVGVFCNTSDTDINDKMNLIRNYIVYKSKQLWGIEIVVVIKGAK